MRIIVLNTLIAEPSEYRRLSIFSERIMRMALSPDTVWVNGKAEIPATLYNDIFCSNAGSKTAVYHYGSKVERELSDFTVKGDLLFDSVSYKKGTFKFEMSQRMLRKYRNPLGKSVYYNVEDIAALANLTTLHLFEEILLSLEGRRGVYRVSEKILEGTKYRNVLDIYHAMYKKSIQSINDATFLELKDEHTLKEITIYAAKRLKAAPENETESESENS